MEHKSVWPTCATEVNASMGPSPTSSGSVSVTLVTENKASLS